MKTNRAASLTNANPQAYPRLKPLALALLSMTPWSAAPVLAADGGQIVQGQGNIQTNQQTTTINQQSNALILSWKNFNIAPNERVQFLQPSSSSIALNRVLSSDPTGIFGQLLANGQIFLINPNGITFGANAQVNVGSLVASTLDISDADFLGGAASGKFTFSGAGNGRIVNHGAINASNGGYIALIGKQVSNQGMLNAPQGTVALAAGERVTLSHISGLLNVSVEAATLDALVENKQAIRADGGQVILSAAAANALLNTVVNQTGIIEARSIENKNGRIFLSGGSSGVVTVAGTLDARGKNSGERGGAVTITGENIALTGNASIDASGAVAGGSVLVGGDYQGGGDTPRANALWMDASAHIAANATQDGPGGKVVLWSDEATRTYGSISATGNQAGGLVETSGHYLDVAGIRVDASSANGLAGLWLLDPNNISIQTAGANTNISAGPNFNTTKDSAILTTATIQAALNTGGGTSVAISTATAAPNTQAGNITVAANSKINYTGTNASVGLTLNAHNNIVVNAGTAITASAGKLNVTLNAGKQVSGNGVITLATTSVASNGGKITLNGAPNGGGASGPRGVLLTASTLNAAGGDIALTATGGTTGTTTNRGVELSGSTLSTSGAGNITLTGTGGSKANNYGVLLTATSKLQAASGTINVTGIAGKASTGTGIGMLLDTTSIITTTSGNVSIAGTGSTSATGGANHGVQINSTKGVNSTSGNINISGTSGAGTTNDVGVRIVGASPLTTGGNITVTGTSNGKGTSNNFGVEMNNSTLTTTGAGTIALTGNGGGKANGYGVYVTATSKLQTANGSATLVGNAGAASTAAGIGLLLDNKANIVSGAGNVSITGTGSVGATVTGNNGVQINTINGVSSTGGNIQITGTSGTGTGTDYGVRVIGAAPITTGGSTLSITGKSISSGAATTNVGVDISGTSKLTNSNAAGVIDITGTGGGGAGTNRFGVNIAGSTVQATAGGSINVTGVGGGKFAGINIAAANPIVGNAATKNITLTASNGGGGDALAIAAGSKLLGTGTLTVQGPNAATTMGVGGAASATFNVQMDTTELGFIQPGFADIVFGRSDGTGAITVGAGTTKSNTTIQGATSNISINGAFATTGSKLTLATAGTVTESGVSTLTVNAGAGTLQLQNGGTFNLTNNNNTGTLNANGAALNFRDDSGFVVSGITTTGNITLSTAGNVTQTGAIVGGGALNLNGAGGVYNLCTQNNDVVTLNANTKTVAFNDINLYALGTLNLTGALELAGDFGSTGSVTATSFLFDAPSRNVTFTNSGNIGTIAANVAGLNYSQAGSVIIGKVSNTMCNPGTVNGITSSGNVAVKTSGANSDISLAANTAISFTGAAPGAVSLNAQRNITLNAGSSIGSTGQAVDVTLNANGQGVAAGGGGITLTSASIASKNGNITLAGDPSGTGFASNKSGNGITLNASSVDAGSGAITLRGEGRGVANAAGVSLINSSVVKSSAAAISITGKNADTSALAGQTGVSIASNSLVSASGANTLTVTGTSGAGTGASNSGVLVQSGGRVSATDGALTVSGTSTSKGAQAIGVSLTGANSSIDSAGTGLLSVTGTGSTAVGATGATGISIANTAKITGKDGATNLAGNGGLGGAGVQLNNGTAGANGLGTFTLAGKGNGTAAGLTSSGAQPILLADQGGTLIVEASNGGGADALVLAAASKIQGNGNLVVRGASAADTMGIGGAASVSHNLQIDQTELATIQLGLTNITFGRNDGTGLITVGAGSTNSNTIIQGNTANITINGAFATTASTLTISTGGTVTESGAGTLTVNAGAGTLQLQNGGIFNLTNNNNTGTLDATGTSLNFRDDSGFVVSAVTTTGNVTLSTAGNVTQTGAIVAGPGAGGTLNLNGVGGVYDLCTQNNDIDTLNANTKTVAFKDINSYALGTLNLTGALELAGDFGTSGDVTANSFLFDAPAQNVTFTNSGTITTLAANVAGLNYSQTNSLTIGKVTNTFCDPGTITGITSSGNVTIKTTAANSDITLAANTPISFTGAAPGTVILDAQRNIALDAGSSIGSGDQPVDVTLNANGQGVAAGGGGITLTSATIASSNGTITLAGDPSGTGFASNKSGNGLTLNAATLNAGTGAITLRGEGGGAANASGISLANSSTIQSSDGTISLTGKNLDNSALANQTGVSIASNSTLIATANSAISITGTGGTGTGSDNAGVAVQSGGQISANSVLTITGTSTSSGDQAIGLLVTGANSKIANTGNGTMSLSGQGSTATGASNALGISIADTASVTGNDGSTILAGIGANNSAGVAIDNATVGANGLGLFTIGASGDGTAAGLITSGAQPILLADQGGTLILEASNGGGADALVLAATSKIQGNGNLVVRGANAVDTMGVGGAASPAHNLQIDQTELATIQPGLASIIFGRSDGSGLITIGDGSTNAPTTIQAASANVDITGTYSTIGDDLTLTTAGVASETASNHALIINGGAGTLNLLGGGTYNLCKGDNDAGTLTANATELAFNDINNLTLGTPFTVSNDVALGVNGTLTAPSGINGGGLVLFGNNVTFNNLGNVGKLAALVSGDLIYSQSDSYAIDTVNNACFSGATDGISAGGNVSLTVGAGNNVTQSATGLITGKNLSLNGGRFSLTQNNSIAALNANAEELALRDDGGFAVNSLIVSGATRLISNGGTVTQTGAIIAAGLALTGTGGVFNLSNSGNKINTLAADGGEVRFASSSGYVLGSVTTTVDGITTAGVKANSVGLTSGGLVTQDVSGTIDAIGLALNGAGGSFNLNESGNDVQTFAANSADVRFADGNGFNIGSVTTLADGVTTSGATLSNNLGLSSDGVVTQSAAIAASGLALNGTNGTFNLSNLGNKVATFAASAQDIRFAAGNGFDIGSVTTLDGSTTTGLSATGTAGLTTNGSVTQSKTIAAPALALNGAGGVFNLSNIGNDVQTLALDTQAVRFADGNGFAIGSVTTLADGTTTVGATVTADLGLSSNGAVTQAAAITAPALALNGSGGQFNLDHAGNDVNSIAANSTDVFFRDVNGYAVAAVTTSADALTTNGLTVTNSVGLDSNGVVTQTAPIIAPQLALSGNTGAFNLGLSSNDVTTLAANTASLQFNDDNGFNIGTVTTLNANVTGLTTSGNAALSAANGIVTQDGNGPIQVGGGTGTLNLVGGSFDFAAANNDVGLLQASGVGLLFRDDNGFSVDGITMSDTACLLSDGNVTQTAAAIVANSLGLGGAGTFVLNGASNDVNTFAASGQALVFRDANGFDIGTVTPSSGLPKSGINVIENAVIVANGDVTQSAAIIANGLALGGGTANYSLNNSANQITTLAANANKLNYAQANSLAIGSVTGVDLSVTDGITVADQVTIQTTSATANLTLNSAVSAQGLGFAAVLSTQNDFLNNVGASAISTPNGNWVVYANNPTTSVFNGLTAPNHLFGNSIATLAPSALPGGANTLVFQSAEPPAPPPPPPAPLNPRLYGAGPSILDFNIAETTRADLLTDIDADDFLDAWKKIAYVSLEVVYGGMKLPEGLATQEVELQKLRRRLGITGDPMHRYIWWR